jgi:hypothetical protein
MPGSAPAGTIGTVGTTAMVAPVAPDTPASPGSPLAEAGAANTRIRTTVAKAVAGAVDRRRDVVVVMLPLVCASPRRLPNGSENVDPRPPVGCPQRRRR